jgi:hypothetical protein
MRDFLYAGRSYPERKRSRSSSEQKEKTVQYPDLTIEDVKHYIEEGCRTGVIKTHVGVMLPDTASRYLLPEVNTDNFRKGNPSRIERYVLDRRDNLWVDGVADIAVDTKGVLVNGQHVLEMISRGLPTIVRFTVGLPPEAANVWDTGAVRTTRAVAEHAGYSPETVAAFRHYLPLKNGTRTATIPTIDQSRILGLLEENPWFTENFEEAFIAAKKLKDVTGTSTAVATAVYLWMKETVTPAKVSEFFDGTCGVGTADDRDPRHFTMRALQSSPILRLMDGKRAPGSLQEHKEKMFLVKGYIHWVSGARAVYSFDDARKPDEFIFSDGSLWLDRGNKTPEL